MTIESRAEQLLAMIEAHRDARSNAILDEARERCARLRGEAAASAHARMRAAFAEERRHAAERIGAAQARLDTRRRIVAQHRAQALLAAAWQQFPPALMQRWADPVTRRTWIAHAIATAREVLRDGAWRIVHAADWDAAEREALARELAPAGIALAFTPDEGIRAGLRIHAGANMIDCTLDGLLADRADIGARLLFALEHA